MPNKSRASCQS